MKFQDGISTMACKSRKELDIKTASDYSLGDDTFINGLAFLDACGVLEDFFEKCYTAQDAFNDDSHRYDGPTEDDVLHEDLDGQTAIKLSTRSAFFASDDYKSMHFETLEGFERV